MKMEIEKRVERIFAERTERKRKSFARGREDAEKKTQLSFTFKDAFS